MKSVSSLRLLITGLVGWLVLIGLAPAAASSANISHSYQSNRAIPEGSLVSLDAAKSDYIEPANTQNGSRLLGISTASSDSLLAVDPSSSTVQVATSGDAKALVSTLNGDIKVGDQIAVSPFNGIGMKSEAGSHVIGLAQTDLNDNSEGVTRQEVTDKSGNTKQISVGLVRVTIAVGTDNVAANGIELNSLQKLGKSLTGKVISTQRILISLAIAIVAMVALITLIYGSIFGSIISIGRNPLAKQSVFRSLGGVVMMAVLIAIVASGAIFFILR